MNHFNSFELTGIFAAVAIMAISLVFIRFGSDTFTLEKTSVVQPASVVVAETDSQGELRNVLENAVNPTGELEKLVIDDVRIGSGETVKSGDTVSVHYKGTLSDGSKFDDSYVRGEPFTFTVGEGMVIAGWEKGIVGMKVGGERILVIPPDLAYGNRVVGPIPANSILIFAIELVAIN